jgi:drug/metabolite transporter (DMT)-like permease
LIAVTSYGFAMPYARRHISPLQLDVKALTCVQLSLASLSLLPGFLIDGVTHSPTLRGSLSMLVLGIVGTGIAFMLNFRVIELAGSSTASTVTYLSPVVATIAGIIVLGEHIHWYQPVGGLVVLLGAAIGQGRLRRRLHVS